MTLLLICFPGNLDLTEKITNVSDSNAESNPPLLLLKVTPNPNPNQGNPNPAAEPIAVPQWNSLLKTSRHASSPCSYRTTKSEFKDFTNSKNGYWSSIDQKDILQYKNNWMKFMSDYDASLKNPDSGSTAETHHKHDHHNSNQHNENHDHSEKEKSTSFAKSRKDFALHIKTGTRGVMYSTGSGQVKMTIHSIRNLRASGCRLPVEIWHLNELKQEHIEKFEKIKHVKVYNLGDAENFDFEREGGKMFQVKVAAMLASSLDEILYLDSDNYPIISPEFMFSHPAFIETGAIFWPDFWKTHPLNPIWEILGIKCVNEFEQESGQILVKKTYPGTLRALTFSLYLQEHSYVYFKLILGDKDTFRLGFRALEQPFHLVRANMVPVGDIDGGGDDIEHRKFNGHTMMQWAPIWGPEEEFGKAPDGWKDSYKPLFMHGNLLKYHGDFLKTPDLLWHKIQRYSEGCVGDGIAEFDGYTRWLDVDGCKRDIVRIENVEGLEYFEDLFRKLGDNL